MKKLRLFCSLVVLLSLSLLSACSQGDRAAVDDLLSQRSIALKTKDLDQYQGLIADDYHALGRTKTDVVGDMQNLFLQFDAIEMQTYNRHIHLVDDMHAACEQNYTLRVLSDGDWRNLTRKEQLFLEKKEGVWKIVSGL